VLVAMSEFGPKKADERLFVSFSVQKNLWVEGFVAALYRLAGTIIR